MSTGTWQASAHDEDQVGFDSSTGAGYSALTLASSSCWATSAAQR